MDLDSMEFVTSKVRIWLFPLFYSRKDHESLFSFFYIHPDYLTIFKNYKSLDFHRVFLFPLFYKQTADYSIFSLLWIAHPILSIYHSHISSHSTLRRILLLWYYFKTQEEKFIQFFYLFPKYISLYKYYSRENLERRFIFPLYYKETQLDSSITSLLWLFHPIVSAYCSYKTSDVTMSWIVLLYWYKNTGDVVLQLVWIFPEWVSLYKYFRSVDYDLVRHFVFPLYYREKARERRTTALFWLFHPMAACYNNTKASFHRVWLFPLFWYRKDQETYFQLAWIVPRHVSLYKYYKTEVLLRHWIFLVYFKEISSEFSR